MNYLLDTCVVSDFFKKDPATINHFQTVSPTQIHISSVTVMEIEYGLALNPDRTKKIRPVWDSLLQAITIIAFCSECATKAASLRAGLKAIGLPIGPFDILIAGTALAHNLILVTSNTKEFKRITELTAQDWRDPALYTQTKSRVGNNITYHKVSSQENNKITAEIAAERAEGNKYE